MGRSKFLATFVLTASLSTGTFAAVTTTVIDLPTATPTRLLDVRPANAIASIVAFSGGNGVFGITGPSVPAGAVCIPPGRNVTGLTDHGVALVLVDSQYSDVTAAVNFLWNRDHLPIWVMSGSSGTLVGVGLAVDIPLTIPLGALFWAPSSVSPPVAAQIRRPVQMIYNTQDSLSNVSAPAFYDALTAAPAREIVPFSGGVTTGCDGGFHLLTGLDAEWLSYTLAFIDKYNGTLQPAPSKVAAIEYFHAQIGHYFLTAQADEQYGLDNQLLPGWVRTGNQFNVWDSQAAGTSAVFRLFTVKFASKAAHFYTADPVERDGRRTENGGDWTYEKIAYYLKATDTGTCGAGEVPIYRMFNNGQTGAPNHRFTTSLATYQDFTTTKGWLGEGIRFCAPS